MKVREEIGYTVDVGERKIGTARESVQLLGRQIPVLPLNLPQVVEDQTVIISAEPPDNCTGLARRVWLIERCV